MKGCLYVFETHNLKLPSAEQEAILSSCKNNSSWFFFSLPYWDEFDKLQSPSWESLKYFLSPPRSHRQWFGCISELEQAFNHNCNDFSEEYIFLIHIEYAHYVFHFTAKMFFCQKYRSLILLANSDYWHMWQAKPYLVKWLYTHANQAVTASVPLVQLCTEIQLNLSSLFHTVIYPPKRQAKPS